MVLPEIDLPKAIEELSKEGWIESLREGDTGIGKTIETMLNIPENNIGEPDCIYKGLEIELKSHRAHSKAMLTLFTLEAGVRNLNDVELMKKYGYTDKKGRQALKVTLPSKQFSPQGLIVKSDTENKKLKIIDKNNDELWIWSLPNIKLKLHNLCVIYAETKKENDKEYFKIVRAMLAINLKEDCFFKLVDEGIIKIDLRMHTKENGTSRNHGTGFRLSRVENLILCYNRVETIFDGYPVV